MRALISVSSKCLFLFVTFLSSSFYRNSNLLVKTLENSMLMLHTYNICRVCGRHINKL